MTIRVLIVDDSPTMRALLSELLRSETDIDVIGTASDASEARAMIRTLDPDVVTLDLEMPGMHGLDFLERLMRLRPTPVVVVSGLTREGADATAQALAIGAVDCYAKPDGRAGDLLRADGGRLAELVRIAAEAKRPGLAMPPPSKPVSLHSSAARMVAIGASTGGVEALQVVLANWPADCPPTLVVQHINGDFAAAVARRLDGVCAPKIVLAEPDLRLQRGHVYLAPGNERHLEVRGEAELFTRLRPGEPMSGHRPSVDMLFLSAAALGADAVGILLTGMGSDGAAGLLAMRRAGAHTVVQDQATSTVFGMPRAALALGAADAGTPITRIAETALARAA